MKTITNLTGSASESPDWAITGARYLDADAPKYLGSAALGACQITCFKEGVLFQNGAETVGIPKAELLKLAYAINPALQKIDNKPL